MTVKFSKSEKILLNLFKENTKFTYNKSTYKVLLSAKPSCSKGSPKTDVYVLAMDIQSKVNKEFKISFKQKNAHFIENKIMPDRAHELLGKNYSTAINSLVSNLKSNFKKRKLIFKSDFGKSVQGSITLGWRLDISRKKSGDLCIDSNLSRDQILDAYSGTSLNVHKKNSLINGKMVENSGVAEYIIDFDIDEKTTLNKILSNMKSIDAFISEPENSKLYFVFKALNYNIKNDKWDGSRCLAVYTNWSIVDNKLNHDLIFNDSLNMFGHNIAYQLKNCLSDLNINKIEDLNQNNTKDYTIVHD